MIREKWAGLVITTAILEAINFTASSKYNKIPRPESLKSLEVIFLAPAPHELHLHYQQHNVVGN